MTLIQRTPKGKFTAVWYETGPDGKPKQRWKSTGTNKRSEAEKIAGMWDELVRKKRVSEAFRDRTAELQRELMGGDARITVVTYIKGWMEQQKRNVRDATFRNHLTWWSLLETWLKPRKLDTADIAVINRKALQSFLDEERDRTSVATANNLVVWLGTLFRAAQEESVIVENPMKGIEKFRQVAAVTERREFTVAEVQALLAVADDEWQSMIMFAVYTGQRLKDLATLKWRQVEIEHGEIAFTTSKTSRRTRPAIGSVLMNWLLSRPMPDNPEAFVHPASQQSVVRNRGTSALGQQFNRLMARAGVRESMTRTNVGGKRRTFDVSFHSFRHTYTTWLKMAGASSAVAMDSVGHDSKSSSQVYTHVDTATKRRFADLLPDVRQSPHLRKRPA